MHKPSSKQAGLLVAMMLIALGFVLSRATHAQGQTQRSVLAEASAETYWIARVGPGDPLQPIQSIVQSRAIGAAPQWKQIAQIDQPIVSLASSNGRLAALLDDGQWLLLWDDGSANGPEPQDGAKLVALGGDGTQTLWAIALARKGGQPTAAGATQPAATLPADQSLLYRLDQGQWSFVASLPPELAAMQKLTLIGGAEPLIAGLSETGTVSVLQWHDNDQSWLNCGTFAAPAGTTQLKFLSGLDREALWLANETGSGELRERASAADMSWSRRIALQLPSPATGAIASDAVIAGGKIRVILVGSDEKTLEYSFSEAGGEPQKTQVPAVTSEPQPQAFEIISAAAAALLVIVLVNTIRRRDGAEVTQDLETGALQLAPHGRRFLAGLIDALPWLGTMAVIFARSTSQQTPQDIAEANQSLIFMALAIYVLHTMVSEALWGWTIGKKLLGLRVVALDGSPPTVRAAILRNILRIVDVTLSFLPTLFVLVSPLRQRTGDIAANTIVVKDQPAGQTHNQG